MGTLTLNLPNNVEARLKVAVGAIRRYHTDGVPRPCTDDELVKEMKNCLRELLVDHEARQARQAINLTGLE